MTNYECIAFAEEVFQAIRQNEKGGEKDHAVSEECLRRKSGIF